ncbi:MAG: hypothetical protein RBS07_02995 [Lentimicrobium sp.]|nr:hypothetical protein [Lentimicrobium sp.]
MKNTNTFGVNRLNGRVPEIPGIRLLNRIIMVTIGRAVLKVNTKEEMPSYFVAHPFDVNSLRLTRKWLLFNAVVHFFLIFLCLLICYFFYTKGYIGGVVFIFFVILFNIALIFMQWMNRKRIAKIISDLNRRALISGRKAN